MRVRRGAGEARQGQGTPCSPLAAGQAVAVLWGHPLWDLIPVSRHWHPKGGSLRPRSGAERCARPGQFCFGKRNRVCLESGRWAGAFAGSRVGGRQLVPGVRRVLGVSQIYQKEEKKKRKKPQKTKCCRTGGLLPSRGGRAWGGCSLAVGPTSPWCRPASPRRRVTRHGWHGPRPPQLGLTRGAAPG